MKKTREFTGWHMLAITCGFFAVVISVNLVMAMSASRTWTGLVVPNSYVASQQYQEKLDNLHAQNEAGWRISIAYEDGELIVDATEGGEPIVLDDVSAFVRRPVGGHDDVEVALEWSAEGYRAPLTLAKGVWDVTVTTAETTLGPIARETRITAP